MCWLSGRGIKNLGFEGRDPASFYYWLVIQHTRYNVIKYFKFLNQIYLKLSIMYLIFSSWNLG